MKPTVADNRTPNLLILRVPAAPSFLDTEEVRSSSPPGPTIPMWNARCARPTY